MSRTFAAIAALTFILASSAASAQTLKTADTAKGKTFVDDKGMTLYTFDKDAGGKSMCNGPCAANWPPLTAAADAKPTADMTIVVRDDGSKMWAYKGKPLDLSTTETMLLRRTNGGWKIVHVHWSSAAKR